MAWKFWKKDIPGPRHRFKCLKDFRSRVFGMTFSAGQRYSLSVSSEIERDAFAVLEAEGKMRRL